MATMPVLLDTIDNVPVQGMKFTFEFERWLTTLADSLNSTIQTLQSTLYTNGLTIPQFTTVQITAIAVNAPNGTLWYDTTTNNIKAKSNGIVVIIV
jgi:hypothetical protein